ncbi:MAG TPA: autotransporter-associated beta strand repeat-containing protein, partial [Candidatus Acidoferrum sp.]|nr:autotransporter-associated beta strand repeat-containing protein [Candidatus Acidoferrum sp.]
MKKLNLKRIKLIPVSLGFLLCAQAHHAKAANLYFCPSGSPPVNGGSYSWDDPNWSTSTSCSSPGAWQQGSFPEFHGGSISYTVTVNNTEQYVGLYNSYDAGSTATLIITNAGSGNLQLQPNASLTDGFPTQGHFGSSSGSTTKIYAPITGTGGVNVPASSGNLYLLGNNTYSGGTTFSSTATLCYFNNNNSFGSGYCCSSVGAGSFANILSTGGSSGSPLTITLPNNWTNGHGGYINFASTAYTPVVCTGNWQLGNFAMNIRNNGDTTASLTLSGVISGPGSTMTFSGQNGGKITLSGANTYSGATTIAASGGTSPIVVSVASINSVTTPAQSASSSLGKPSAGNGTISLGSAASSGLGGTLIYTGSGETSDRAINLAGTTGGATIEMDGAGPLVLTSAFTASGAGSKTLTLQGSSTAANTIGGAIVDNSSVNKTTVVKAQAGTWKLSGASTYTGGTTVSNGTLEVAGSIAGNVTVQGGVLQLDSPTALSSGTSATVTLAGSLPNHSVNLNFSGTQPINALIIGGVSQPVGTYGASGADHNLAVFTGSGLLNVAGAPTVTTQPQSVAVWAGGSATFTVAATGAPTYQWKRNGANVGANSSALTINPVGTGNAGTYVCWLTNAYGWTVTSNAYLTVRSENAYTAAITNEPGLISYYRLDETGGTTAYDCFGNNNGTYNNAIQGVTPGAIAIDPNDACVNLATNKINNNKSYVSIPGGATAFNFFAPSGLSANFTLECWAYFTNLTFTPQRMFSSVNSGFADGYGFGISSANQLEFSCFGYEDYNAPLTTPL